MQGNFQKGGQEINAKILQEEQREKFEIENMEELSYIWLILQVFPASLTSATIKNTLSIPNLYKEGNKFNEIGAKLIGG